MDVFLNVVTVPAIVFIVYWIINLLKLSTNYNENFMKFIPLIAAGVGAVLGVVIFYLIPEVVLADNVLNAIITGGASGLAATGTNQIFKQLNGSKNTPVNTEKK